MNEGMWRRMEAGPYADDQQQYYDQPTQEAPMDGVEPPAADGDSDNPKRKLKHWEKIGPDGRPIKRKPNPAKRNALFRKALQPKSSIMCLNELQAGLKYITEPVATIGNFCVSVEVNGQTFRGYGSTKDLAKQAAAEAALVSFVKPPPPKPTAGEPTSLEEDTTPWRTLASFAMYKLFMDWRDGRIGMCQPGLQNMPGALNMCAGFPVQQLQQMQQHLQPAMQQQGEQSGSVFSNVSAHLTRGPSSAAAPAALVKMEQVPQPSVLDTVVAPKPIRPNKQNAEAQRTQHPVMVLHQLCPGIQYTNTDAIDPNTGKKVFTVTACINGHEYSETATAIKKAKFLLAKTALKDAFDVDNIYAAS
ncbi:double-stranded RNA-specific editase 1 isoform X2 [Hyalella azteca]|uniref:Double-stranded RNA-specific editase 1 isoform X2 n=1 Tax=Hyalella azteca TaxID=294128 RepID=A0A8B7N668_HYAAZ|nr:double-stranded RNA-specific editase 1 isoform X2 [Hyalella azteca]